MLFKRGNLCLATLPKKKGLGNDMKPVLINILEPHFFIKTTLFHQGDTFDLSIEVFADLYV